MMISTQQVHPIPTENNLLPSPTALSTSAELTPIASNSIQFQLPPELAQVFRDGAGDELNDFASYALTRFMLREHWVELENCPLRPFVLQMTHDVVDYQLAPDADTAISQAEAIGEETVIQVELDLGFTMIETFEDEQESA